MATTNKTILDEIQNVVTGFSGQSFVAPVKSEMLKEIKPIQQFFEVTTQQAIILAVMIDYGMRNEEASITSLVDYFDGKLTTIIPLNQTLNELIKKGFLVSKTTGKAPSAITKQSFLLEDQVLEALFNSNTNLLKQKPITTLSELLERVKSEFQKREQGAMDGATLVTRIGAFMQESNQVNLAEWLKAKTDWTAIDKALFLIVAVNHIEGNKMLDLEYTIKQLMDVFTEQYLYRTQIIKKNNPMFIQSYLRLNEEEFIFDEYVSLTEKSQTEFLDIIMSSKMKKEFKPTMGQVILPEKIAEEVLFYNDTILQQIETIKRALQKTNYDKIVSQLSENNMGLGISVLLHGYAGTGKTATVKQIAKQTNRTVFLVEIEKIRSKWVGESEKNLKKVFEEYYNLSSSLSEIPILLFNEADAILGKRVEATSAADKSHNTLQNILLQELEDFRGISFSTTNLAGQLDTAFERRFLYKVAFEKPTITIRQQLMAHNFSSFKQETLLELGSNYELTGGQVGNVKKKLLLKSIVEDCHVNEDDLQQLCREELSFGSSLKSKVIGFGLN